MNPLILIALLFAAGIAALCLCYFGMALLAQRFGQGRVESYVKMRVQGPFVPTPEDVSIPKPAKK